MMTMSESHLLLCFLSVLLLCCVPVSSFFIYNDPVDGLVACRPHQIQAVTQFKNEFDSSGCNQTEFFNGVWCDNTTGEVTKLQLPSGCLSGTLNPNSSLFGLHHLRYLNLSYNDFTSSSLPYGFGNLNKLEILCLISNGFIGQIPSSFNNLSQLSILDLSHNEFTGSFPLLRNLSKLYLLNLSNNYLSGTLNPNISLFELHHLRYLDLGYNSFISSSIPFEFGNLNKLEVLSLSSNGFIGQVPPSFRNLSQLTELYLSHNKLTEFPNILKPLQNLGYINISHNKIKGKVPAWFWSLPRLFVVIFINNALNGFEGSTKVLVKSSVQMLFLDSNSFEGTLPNLPLSIINFSAWNNKFKGHIPLSICNHNSLIGLDLSYNNFTGPIPPCLSNVTLLSLRNNNLEGSLPDIFYADSSLRTLDVGYNQLTGKLPKSLLNCSSLEHLSVGHNRIEDTFPFWLKALPNLQILILRSNKLYGSIAPPIQGSLAFPELRIFEISDNNFTGMLPPSYFLNWKATSLQMNEDATIYMGYNSNLSFGYDDRIDLQYKGLFTENGKVLTSYSTIDFSGNRIEGQIPESVGLLKGLIALNLSNNAFSGHIPLSLANLTELESLDLSKNQLSGTIPNGLKTLSFLEYINVSHNQLKGEIPQGTQIIGQSQSSFEGNAGLCGLPLEESCFGTNAKPTQQPEKEDEEEEEVLNWKGVVIGYGLGVLLGLAIAQVIASYKPEWLAKIIGPNKRRNR